MAEPKEKKPAPAEGKPHNPLRLVSLGFLVVAVWILATALYSRSSIAPALGSMADDPLRRGDARRLMKRATWLVLGSTLFRQKLRDGRISECVSSKSLADAEADFVKMLDGERKTAEKLLVIPDPLAAARYGPACAQYISKLKLQRAEGAGPSDAEALAVTMQHVEHYVTCRMVQRYGEGAAALLLELHRLEKENKLSDKKREELNEMWSQLAAKEITDFQRLVMINGRNGYIFGGFLLLVSAGFLLISLFARSFIPQDPVDEAS